MAVATVLLFNTGCHDILYPTPQMDISDETALTTYDGLQAALIGAYNKLQDGDLYGGTIWTGGEMLANNVKKSGEGNIVYEETQLLEKIQTADNRISGALWYKAYEAIYLCNSILEALPEVTDPKLTDTERNRIKGEALFIRAILYFDMVRYFGNPNTGDGVPLVLTVQGINEKPARNTIDEVYNAAVSDLEEAAGLLPESNENRATSWAAKAYLARVHFFRKEYGEAAQYCTEVIENGPFQLVDSLPLNYSSGPLSKEVIFAMMSTNNDASSWALHNYYRQASGGKFSPSNYMKKLFLFTGGTADKRYSQLMKEENGKTFVTKFDELYMHVPLMRLAEMYITRAECRFELGNTAGTVEDYNVIRKRANLPEENSINLTKLYYERSKELAFEGDMLFNMKRREMTKISDKELPWNDVKLLYLIPQREIEVNPNLVQNE